VSLCITLNVTQKESGTQFGFGVRDRISIKKGLNKRFILHEFYHHLVSSRGLDIPSLIEERNARDYSREFLRR